MDLIRCNICSKYVCELCNDIPVPKVKQIFNICNTLYFICKTCDQEIHDPGQHKMDVNLQNPEADKDELIKSLQEIFDTKLTTMEARLTTMFDEKLTSIDNIMKTSNICIDSTLPDSSLDSDVSNSVNPNLPTSASKVLKLPQEVKKIMLDAENEKKIEENEQERRAKNFIIHGADEIDNNTDEIKKKDIEFLAHILRKIDVNSQPESINRLGRPNETNRHTIKIVMESKTDQENVMANGKIRVTHDYTNNERDLIRRTVKVAEEKSEENTERVYRVRGDPKKWSSIGLLSKEMAFKASMYNGNKF